MGTRRKRWLPRALWGGAALFSAAALALPWWWPRAVCGALGIQVGRTITHGWSTVELRDVLYRRGNVEVAAGVIRLPALGYWPGRGDSVRITAEDVQVRVFPQESRRPGLRPSVTRGVEDFLRTWPAFQRWVPSMEIERLQVSGVGGPGSQALADSVTWTGDRLRVHGIIPGRDDAVTVTLRREDRDRLSLAADSPGIDAGLEATARVEAGELQVDAALRWRGNRVRVRSRFGAEGLLPREAVLTAPGLLIPAHALALPAYGDIRGDVEAAWDGRAYSARLAAQAQPGEPDLAPPVDVDVRVRGDLSQLELTAARVRVPGVELDLEGPLKYSLQRGEPTGPARLSLTVDFARLPGAPAAGKARGKVVVGRDADGGPHARFALAAQSIRWRGRALSSIRVDGRWIQEQVQIDCAQMLLGSDSSVRGRAVLDLREERISSSTLEADVAADAVRPWWPDAPAFGRLRANVTARGPWLAPRHSGRLSWQGLDLLPGEAIDGELTWDARGIDSVECDGALQSDSGITLPLALRVSRSDGRTVDVEMAELAWIDHAGEWWRLSAPVRARLADGRLEVAHVDIAGPEVALALAIESAWPTSGHVSIDLRGLDAGRLAPLLGRPWHRAVLERCTLDASWDRGTMRVDGGLRGIYRAAESSPYRLEAEIRSESGELVFDLVRVTGASGTLLEGRARLPGVLAGSDDPLAFQLPTDGPFSLHLSVVPDAPFWRNLADATGWTVKDPELRVHLGGTLSAPHGRAELAIASVQPPVDADAGVSWPEISAVEAVAEMDAGGVRVTQGVAKLDEHWISLAGHVPWTALGRSGRTSGVPWRAIEASVTADRLPMSIAAQALPHIFAPDGSVSFEIKHTPGSGFSGFLWLDELGVRPIQPLGSIRDIEGRVLLEGQTLTLRQVAAHLGGRPVELGGRADLSDVAKPTFDLRLLSSGVPIVREGGLVLRAALDLRIRRVPGETTRVTGSAELDRSVFVSDLLELLPRGEVRQPEQRPPYFSVKTEPFAEWRLDVALRGDDFLEISSPFLRTGLSCDFRLRGTLREPRAVGRAWADSGSINFPFGELEVRHAEAILSPEDPYTLEILASADTRLYGHALRLEVDGPAAEPRLVFTSDPPLSSQEVFLMLTAGELPESEDAFTTSERTRRLGWFVARNLARTFGVGDGAGGERLSVRSGEDFSREGSETIHVQYDVDDRWSVVGERDRFDDYNAGIKLRLIDR